MSQYTASVASSSRSTSTRRSTTSSHGSRRTDLATRLSTVGGFSAGSGRDTFITWNRGGHNKDYHEPGKERHTFNHGLRGTVNTKHSSHRKKTKKALSSNPTGRWRPKAPKIYHDKNMKAYGKCSIDPGNFSVAEMFATAAVVPSPHSTPKQNRAKMKDKILKHIRNVHVPVRSQRKVFIAKSKLRQKEASKWEKHSSGRVRVNKVEKGHRNCHG